MIVYTNNVKVMYIQCIHMYEIRHAHEYIVFRCSLVKVTEKGTYKVQVRMSP